jgi:hypothetical protein
MTSEKKKQKYFRQAARQSRRFENADEVHVSTREIFAQA